MSHLKPYSTLLIGAALGYFAVPMVIRKASGR